VQLHPSEPSQFEHMTNLPFGGLRRYDEARVGPRSRRRNTNRDGEQQPALIPACRCTSAIALSAVQPNLLSRQDPEAPNAYEHPWASEPPAAVEVTPTTQARWLASTRSVTAVERQAPVPEHGAHRDLPRTDLGVGTPEHVRRSERPRSFEQWCYEFMFREGLKRPARTRRSNGGNRSPSQGPGQAQRFEPRDVHRPDSERPSHTDTGQRRIRPYSRSLQSHGS